MPNIFNVLSEDAFTNAMDTLNASLAGMLMAQGGSIIPETWAELRMLVRLGLASKAFAVGDQLTCKKNNITLVWDIIGFDQDVPADSQYAHSLTLQLHDVYGTYMQFDAREAFYFAASELAAGTYHFTVGVSGGPVAAGTYQFTVEQAIPAGGQLVFSLTDASKIDVFASGSDTEAQEISISSGSAGTDLGTLDNSVQSQFNSLQRATNGSNRYKESAIRQYLNSDAAAGSVWTPQNPFERPPEWAASTDGWMHGMDEDFLAVLGRTKKSAAKSTINGGEHENVVDKFFLPSADEVYAEEGTAYAYYQNYSELDESGTDADSNRIKRRNNAATFWALRSPVINNGGYIRTVQATGAVANNSVRSNIAVAPMCCII